MIVLVHMYDEVMYSDHCDDDDNHCDDDDTDADNDDNDSDSDNSNNDRVKCKSCQ